MANGSAHNADLLAEAGACAELLVLCQGRCCADSAILLGSVVSALKALARHATARRAIISNPSWTQLLHLDSLLAESRLADLHELLALLATVATTRLHIFQAGMVQRVVASCRNTSDARMRGSAAHLFAHVLSPGGEVEFADMDDTTREQLVALLFNMCATGPTTKVFQNAVATIANLALDAPMLRKLLDQGAVLAVSDLVCNTSDAAIMCSCTDIWIHAMTLESGQVHMANDAVVSTVISLLPRAIELSPVPALKLSKLVHLLAQCSLTTGVLAQREDVALLLTICHEQAEAAGLLVCENLLHALALMLRGGAHREQMRRLLANV